ncbi:MAG: alpha-ketoacid dehydrogenase subunit beta [Sporichthyaceae bacterium]|nr:alpha-ketoacid dehydrogenase subunit beta [Sporichthyaceae bacterium]
MEADESVILLGEDVGRYGGAYAVSRGLLERFGERRVIDTPMSEALIVGAALGAAMVGARPVAEIMYMDFVTLAMDNLVNQAAKVHYMFGGQFNAPLVVRVQQGTGRGAGSQHSQSLEGWFAHVPGLKVVAPSTPADAKGLLKAAIRDNDPVLFIEHKGLYPRKGAAAEVDHVVPLGVADVKRTGTDVTIVTWSNHVHIALEAAERLSADGVSVEVVDMRCLAPLDMTTVLDSAGSTRRVLVLHEACRTGGLGAEIAATVGEQLFGELAAPVRRLTAPDVVLPAHTELERTLIPDVEDVVLAVRDLLSS